MSRNIIEVDPDKFPWLDLRRYTFCMGAENSGVVYQERPENYRPAPLLGEHNLHVFGELLGLAETDIQRLTSSGAIE